MTIHDRIREARKKLGLTITEFGAPLGYSPSAISKIESAKYPYDSGIPERVIIAICDKHHISDHWLRTGEPPIFLADNQPDEREARLRWVLALFSELSPETQEEIVEIAEEISRIGHGKKKADTIKIRDELPGRDSISGNRKQMEG